MNVTLNVAEQKLAKYLATEITRSCREHGIPNQQVSELDFDEISVDGFAAEIAYCKGMNLYPDLDVYGSEIRPAFDCRWHDGRTVDVKHTSLEHGNLICPVGLNKERKQCDLYALVIGTMPNFRIVGHAYGHVLFSSRIAPLPNGPAYRVMQEDLWMLEEDRDVVW